MSKLTDRFALVAGVMSGLLTILLFSGTSLAVSSSDWNPGRIMDDGIFFDSSSMSATDIQNFLNSKMPTCNTNHARSGSANDSGPPYTCLKNYSENPTTHQNNGIAGGGGGVSGGWSAAQIIKNAADTYGISPKILIVLLQKEQSLVTDDWPWAIQYRSATGYGCPDTAPCDAEYYGLYNQVMNAARQFKRYATNPSEYRYKALQNNFIQWNPNTACGGSIVGIQNQTTAGLYNYTPYQPNGYALAGGTSSAYPECGAFGNRNFWKYYNDWFGSTLAAPKENPAYKAGEGGGSAASWEPARLDLSLQGTNNTGANTYAKSFNNYSGWSDFIQDTSNDGSKRVASQIASTSWGPGRTDIFARSENSTLIHKWYTQYVGWSDWEDLGGCIVGAPTVTSWESSRLDIFVQGCNANGINMYHKWYDGVWQNWEVVPGMNARISSAPSAVSWGKNRIDIFARGEGADLIHNWFGGRWYGIDSQGGCIEGQPAVSAWQPGRLDVFVKSCNASGPNVSHKWYANNFWMPWELTPMQQNTRLASMLGATSWSNNRIDIFGRGEDGTLMHQWYDGGWNSWESLGGSVAP